VEILYSQVFTRMIVQWSLTLLSEFLFQLGSLWVRFHASPGFPEHGIDETERSSCSLSFQFSTTTTKTVVPVVSQCIIEYGIPYSVWRGVLLTIVTVAQTSIALPYALGRVEYFLVRAAHGKPNKLESRLRCEDGGGGEE